MTINQNEGSWDRWSIPALDEHATSVFPSIQRAKKKATSGNKNKDEQSDLIESDQTGAGKPNGHESELGPTDALNGDTNTESDTVEESIEVIEEETLQPFSADELLEIRKSVELEAYQSGFEKGEKHGFESGEKKIREELEPKLALAIDQIKTLDKNINKASNELDEGVEALILDCISHLAEGVIRRELKSSEQDLHQLITDALSALPLNQGVAEISLNPKDHDLLREYGNDFDCTLISNDTISQGSCRIKTKESIVDVNLEERISTALSNFMGKPFDSMNNNT